MLPHPFSWFGRRCLLLGDHGWKVVLVLAADVHGLLVLIVAVDVDGPVVLLVLFFVVIEYDSVFPKWEILLFGSTFSSPLGFISLFFQILGFKGTY